MIQDQTQSEYSCSASKVDPDDKPFISEVSSSPFSIELQLCDEEGNCEIELIPDITPIITIDDNILLHDIVQQLKCKGYTFKGAVISYYSIQYDAYIFCAIDPVPSYIAISLNDIKEQYLIIRVKLLQNELKQELKAEGIKKTINKTTKTRIRKIGDVVEKVTQWRRMYTGYVDEEGIVVKMTLMEAATMLDVPKKSLDDYLLLLKMGRQYGFDFNLYKNHTIGTLRSFIRQHKAQ